MNRCCSLGQLLLLSLVPAESRNTYDSPITAATEIFDEDYTFIDEEAEAQEGELQDVDVEDYVTDMNELTEAVLWTNEDEQSFITTSTGPGK